MMYKMQLTLVTGPLSRTRFIPMDKHERESTNICMDRMSFRIFAYCHNTRISERTFFVPLGFEGYLLTIARECGSYAPRQIPMGKEIDNLHTYFRDKKVSVALDIKRMLYSQARRYNDI